MTSSMLQSMVSAPPLATDSSNAITS